MAETTRQRSGELIRKLFEILMRIPDGIPASEALDMLSKEMQLTEFEKSYYPLRPDIRRFEKIVRFSTISPVKAGWMQKRNGYWIITDEGKLAYSKYTDPAEFMRKAAKLYQQWKKEQPEEESEDNDETPGPSATLEKYNEIAWSEIQEYIGKMNPYDFQDLVAGLLRGMGYHVSWVSPPGADKGVDIIAHQDPLGVQGGRIKVQVKRRLDKINVGEIRSFMALLGEDDIGIFVTTNGFTSDAESEARGQEKRRLMLLDSRRLFDLWVEHYNDISEESKRLLPLRPVHFLDLEDCA
jgi:restriction system protein